MKNAGRTDGPGRAPSDDEPATDEAAGDAEPAQVAEYVASMTAELAGMARVAKLDFLAHLLEMARVAAAEAAGQALSRHDPAR